MFWSRAADFGDHAYLAEESSSTLREEIFGASQDSLRSFHLPKGSRRPLALCQCVAELEPVRHNRMQPKGHAGVGALRGSYRSVDNPLSAFAINHSARIQPIMARHSMSRYFSARRSNRTEQ